MSQHVEIVSEPSPIYFLAQCSDKGPSIQHLRPNIEPIYHIYQNQRSGSSKSRWISPWWKMIPEREMMLPPVRFFKIATPVKALR